MGRLSGVGVCAVLLLFSGTSSLFGQTNTGRIVGTINDASGAVMPGVVITVRNPATGLSRSTLTNESGTYAVPLLPPAVYEVAAALPGFRPETRSGITIQVDAVVRVDFALNVGAVNDSIQVTADAPLVQNETATLGEVMDSRKVTDIPLNQRQIMQLTTLTPGIMPVIEGSNLSGQNLSFEAMGARERDNNFLVDGVDNNDPGNAQMTIVPSIDALEEFKISVGNYGAELGRSAGGVLNVQTKSGTDDFHAVFFEFLRNDLFDSRNFFTTSKPPYRRNQFGTVLSGPIKKDKMFFMFNYEGNRIRNVQTALGSVPTLQEHSGDFSDIAKPLIDPITKQPFQGNIIPQQRLDSVGLGLGTFYPLPNRSLSGGSNYLFNGRGAFDFDIITSKVDYRISEKQNVFFRVIWQNAYQEDPNVVKGAQLPKSGNVFYQPIGRNFAISDTYVFGPRVVNEFRVGFNRLIGGIYEELYKQNLTKTLGITGVQSQLYPSKDCPCAASDGVNLGWPRVTVKGYSSQVLGFGPQNRYDNTWHWFDQLAVSRGNHEMKIGGDFRTVMENIYNQGGNANGVFGFDGRFTGNGFADILLGFPSSTMRQVGDPQTQSRNKTGSLYFQDDWKARPNLTLNLGIRWDAQMPPINRLKGLASGLAAFDPSTNQIVIVGRTQPSNFTNPITHQPITVPGGASAFPDGLYFPDWKSYGPRLGFAWSPKGVVVRGGYGVFFDPDIAAIADSFRRSTYPWLIPQTFNADPITPNISMQNPFPDALATGALTAPTIDPHLRNGYMQQWSFGIQRPLGNNMMLDISYGGSKGTKLLASRNINQAILGPGSINSRRPFQGWAAITKTERSQSSTFHSLQAKFERRFSAGMTFISSYTWSHSLDDGGPVGNGGGNIQDNYNMFAEKGNSPYDVRHRLVNSYSYQLPVGSNKHFFANAPGTVSRLISGWQVAGITTFSTGIAFTPNVAIDNANVGNAFVRPNRIKDGMLARSQRTPNRWFDPTAFVIPPAGSFGNAGRGILHGPGANSWDITLMKNTAIGEKRNLQFRAEFFNAFNHPNFYIPVLEVTSPAFGSLNRAVDGRQMQFGLKLYY
jgi:hypothetical protein